MYTLQRLFVRCCEIRSFTNPFGCDCHARPEKPAPRTARLPGEWQGGQLAFMRVRVTSRLSAGKSAMTDGIETEVEGLTPAAARMRRYRRRRRDKFRCLTLELHEAEIDFLVYKGLLPREMRNDVTAIQNALYSLLDQALI